MNKTTIKINNQKLFKERGTTPDLNKLMVNGKGTHIWNKAGYGPVELEILQDERNIEQDEFVSNYIGGYNG